MELIRKIGQYLIAIFLLLPLLSCVENIHMRDLVKLRMGMSPGEPPALMEVSPKKVFQWSMSTTGDSIIVQSYILASGDYNSSYFLAYRNDSLIFWGYPHEFARSSDPLINQIGKEVLIRQSRY